MAVEQFAVKIAEHLMGFFYVIVSPESLIPTSSGRRQIKLHRAVDAINKRRDGDGAAQDAGDTVLDNFRQGADAKGDDRLARAHRLEGDHPECLPARPNGDEIASLHMRLDL